MAKSFPLGRRILAWTLDNLLILGLTLGLVWWLAPQQLGLRPLVQGMERYAPNQGAFQSSVESLTAAEWKAVDQAFVEEVLPAFGEYWPHDVWEQLSAALDPRLVLQQTFKRTFQRLSTSERLAELSASGRAELVKILLMMQRQFATLQFADFLGLFWLLLQPLILVFCLVPLVYFLPELFLGWSLGKLVLGLRLAFQSRDGAKPAGLGIRLWRWLVKGSGWWVSALGVVFGVWWAFAVGMGLGLVLALGNLGFLNDSFQTLHDGLSGTIIVIKNGLKPNP